VCLRKGRLKPAEFRLRPGERGLSLFRRVGQPGPVEVVAAVRAAGKQGDLAAAAISAEAIRALGLVLVSSPGGTAEPEVNRLHAEARLSFWSALWTRLGGRQVD